MFSSKRTPDDDHTHNSRRKFSTMRQKTSRAAPLDLLHAGTPFQSPLLGKSGPIGILQSHCRFPWISHTADQRVAVCCYNASGQAPTCPQTHLQQTPPPLVQAFIYYARTSLNVCHTLPSYPLPRAMYLRGVRMGSIKHSNAHQLHIVSK